MGNPARAIAEQFVRRSPMTLLAFSVIASIVDSAVLYMAAAREGVLYISQGIGLLNHYGLFSTILGNAVFPYLAKKYYDSVCSIRESKALVDLMPAGESLSTFTDITKIDREYRRALYLMIIVGALSWLGNVSYHVIGNPQVKWGHAVFDSTDHPLTFWASRLHNLYTWLVVLPLLAHVIVYSSVQLWRAIARASRAGVLTYDLLNPDRRGGFAFVDKAAVMFNVVVALVYAQIMLHIGTFKMNFEHIIYIILLTLAALLINRMFLGGIYAMIKTLRLKALNKLKDKVYQDDKMSFEILKYCYERRVSLATLVNFAINPVGIVVSSVVKLWPVIAKAFS